jgi:probable rRNA maturation factor
MITIDMAPRSATSNLSISALTRFLNRARLAIDLRGEVDILLANDSALRQLNKTFRGKNKPTDVLSFPAPSAFAKKHAGDLAISLDTASRQALTHGHTLSDEIKILILHGLLHLSGQDHETDNGEMAAREAILRSELRLPAALIERTKRQTTSELLSSGKASSRPKAAHSAVVVEGPLHFVRTTSSARKSKKRGSK